MGAGSESSWRKLHHKWMWLGGVAVWLIALSSAMAQIPTATIRVFATRADVENALAIAGRITTTGSNSSRPIQFALKLLF